MDIYQEVYNHTGIMMLNEDDLVKYMILFGNYAQRSGLHNIINAFIDPDALNVLQVFENVHLLSKANIISLVRKHIPILNVNNQCYKKNIIKDVLFYTNVDERSGIRKSLLLTKYKHIIQMSDSDLTEWFYNIKGFTYNHVQYEEYKINEFIEGVWI